MRKSRNTSNICAITESSLKPKKAYLGTFASAILPKQPIPTSSPRSPSRLRRKHRKRLIFGAPIRRDCDAWFFPDGRRTDVNLKSAYPT